MSRLPSEDIQADFGNIPFLTYLLTEHFPPLLVQHEEIGSALRTVPTSRWQQDPNSFPCRIRKYGQRSLF